MSTSPIEQRDALQGMLKEYAQRSRDARHLHRLHCVSLVVHGHACADVANWLGETTRTVQRWVRAYRLGGINALTEEARPGRPPRLPKDQWPTLLARLSRPPSEAGYDRDKWDSGMLQHCLMEMFDLRFSIRQCQRILRLMQEEITLLADHHELEAKSLSKI